MPNSKVKPNEELSEELWLISILNTGSKLSGHAVIVVEGLKKTDNIFPKLFVGQYDIQAEQYPDQKSSINIKGYISKVRMFESSKYNRDYSKYTSKSTFVPKNKAFEMIAAIKADQQRIAASIESGENLLEYQLVGKNNILADEGAGDNCAGWALEKLAIAGIGDGSEKTKPELVAGGCLLF